MNDEARTVAKNADIWNPSKKDRLIMLFLILVMGGIAMKPVAGKNLFFQGVYLQNLNLQELAQEKYEKSLWFSPHLKESLYALAMAYEETSKENKSIIYCLRILGTDKTYIPCYDLLARVHLRNKNYKSLCEDVSPLLQIPLYKESFYTLKILATAYEKTGQYEKARETWRKVLILQPKDDMAKAKLK